MERIDLIDKDLFSLFFQHPGERIHLQRRIAKRGKQPRRIIQSRSNQQAIIVQIVVLDLIDIVGGDLPFYQIIEERKIEPATLATGKHGHRVDQGVLTVADTPGQLITCSSEVIELSYIIMTCNNDQTILKRQPRVIG